MPSAPVLLQDLRRLRATYGADAEVRKRTLLLALAGSRLRTYRELVESTTTCCSWWRFPGSRRRIDWHSSNSPAFAVRWRGLPAAVCGGGRRAASRARSRDPWWPGRSRSCSRVTRPSTSTGATSKIQVPSTRWWSAWFRRAEQDAFGGGQYSTRQWIALARPSEMTALRWLIRSGETLAPARGFAAAWDAAEVPCAGRSPTRSARPRMLA